MRDSRRRHHRLRDLGRRRLPRPQHRAEPARHGDGHRARAAGARGGAALDRLDHAAGGDPLPRVRDARAVPARPLAAPRLRPRAARRHDVHDARGRVRDRGRRVVVADHPVHDLRRVPAVLRRRQVLPRLLVRRARRKADRRRPHDRALVVPARRAVGLGRGDDGDARHRRLPDAREGGLRAERRRRTARCGRAGRDPLAAGARRGRVPDRRVPEDLVPRRDQDGGDPDLPLLPVAPADGRDRRAQVRDAPGRLRRAPRRVAAHQDDGIPLPLARRDHRLHAARFLADRVGVLGHGGRVLRELPQPRLRAARSRPVRAPTVRVVAGRAAPLQAHQGARGRLGRHAERRRDLRRGRA